MTVADQPLSPIAQCLRIAAQRGRAIRQARECANEPPANVGRALAFVVGLADETPRREDNQQAQHTDQAAGSDAQ